MGVDRELHVLHPSPTRFDHIGSNGGIPSVVGSLHQHVGLQRCDQLQWGVLVEDDDAVHHGEGGDQPGPVILVDDRMAVALEPPSGGVAVDSHDEQIPLGSRGLEQNDMTAMQEIEDAVGEDHGPFKALAPPSRLGSGPDLVKVGSNPIAMLDSTRAAEERLSYSGAMNVVS